MSGDGASARGALDGLRSAHPLGPALPAVYADDDLAQRFVTGLDAMLAPVFTVLDCLEAYFDPALAPADFVDWLADWVGAELGGGEPVEVRRHAVATATALHRRRGTRQGLAEAVRLCFGVAPGITESGGAAWSPGPLGPFPGVPRAALHVTVRLPDPAPGDRHPLGAGVAGGPPGAPPGTPRGGGGGPPPAGGGGSGEPRRPT
ncbi:phage tail protein, partial [Streptomyces sp. NPDC127040]|uniref:phage tail protein n=1 Tax=Streptomyces sp. NPDC127040 TaxID=3347116 RepID=UPI0036613985